MDANDGFVPITAIFYAVFHPTEGTKIVHQVPEGSIASYSAPNLNLSEILFNFDTVKNYIIPKPQLCNKLVSFKINRFRVLGYPVNIEGSGYSRNSFNFNFGFVFPYNSDTTPYESAIRRMGKMFRALEEQSYLLSKLDKDRVFFNLKSNSLLTKSTDYTPGHQKIQKFSLQSIESLIHQIYQDLNNYSECCIPIDSANSVDIKLFPILPPPVNLKAYQVPLLTVKLNLLMDVNWDPTMVKILPYINGLNSVKKISELADADYLLTKNCIQHLMHYQCIAMMDIFQFNNIYAPTNNIGNFLKTNGMAEECQAYIISVNFDDLARNSVPTTAATSNTPPNSRPEIPNQGLRAASASIGSPAVKVVAESASPLSKSAISGSMINKPNIRDQLREIKVPSKATLFYLYRLLNQGQTIKEWYIQHHKALGNIDIRRFITFGVVRGIIYRVNLYPVLHSVTKSLESREEKIDNLDLFVESHQEQLRRKNRRVLASTTDIKDSGLLRSSVKEAKLKTGKKKRTVSFNYHVDRRVRVSDDDEEDDDEDESEDANDSFNRLDVFDSDSESSNRTSSLLHHKISDNISDSEEDGLFELEELVSLIKLMKGMQHFDSVCTELQKSRNDVEKLMDMIGPCSIINS
ncbi:CIC11C00000001784 [Sungouiella intermedia]|uniref:CIC11C00000001784 n=1 Tax=Sungouiella intermedia TaxID=45354 RepID=A0A1L0BTF0_9ASCO|nr:CIC11C00000001784 [[Candida] intermedia]